MPAAVPYAESPDQGGGPPPREAGAFARADDGQLAAGVVGVRTAVLAARSLSYGVGVPDSAPYVRRAAARGLPLIHRSTGGTGLVHEPGDIVWTIVVPRRHPTLQNGFTRAYARLGAGVVGGLAAAGIPAAWIPAPGLVDRYCTLSGLGSVLATGPRVVGGAAQHLTGTHLLHHGVISAIVDRGAVAELFAIPIGPVTDRLGSLTEVTGTVSPRSVARAIRTAVAGDLGIPEID